MRLITFIFLFVFLSAAAQAADKPSRHSVFNSEVWLGGSKDGTMPAALDIGMVRYRLIRDDDAPRVDLRADFETALLVWMKALGIHHPRVAEVATTDEADIVIHFGSKEYIDLPQGMKGHHAHHYTDSYGLRKDKVISVIEVQSALLSENDMYWISLRAARREHARTKTFIRSEEAVVSIEDMFGPDPDPAAMAEYLVAHRLNGPANMPAGEYVKVEGDYLRLAYWTFLHELGHTFGLTDLYPYPGNDYSVPPWDSIMKDMEWRPMVPTKADLSNVTTHIDESGLCHRRFTY